MCDDGVGYLQRASSRRDLKRREKMMLRDRFKFKKGTKIYLS